MVSLNTQYIYILLISFSILLANVHSITTISSTLESEVNDVITEFIGKDIRNSETLLNEIYRAIEYVWLQKEYQELDLRRKEDTISKKNSELFSKVHGIKKKLKKFFRALCIYKAAALIDSIEEKLGPRKPVLCVRCRDWHHEKTNCTNEEQRFYGVDGIDEEQVPTNCWYWMLEHLRDDVDINRLSKYLEQVYYKTNFTTLYNLTADQTPAYYGKFKLIFCFALDEIQSRRYYSRSVAFCIKDAYLRVIETRKISVDKFVEIFLKALGKWVDLEEPSSLHCDDNSIAETTTTTSPSESEIDKVVNVFIGKDISSNETLLQEVKNAIQHVLLKKRNLQHQVLMKNEMIRRKTKEMERNYLDLYKAKLKTYFKALCIYKLAAKLEERFIRNYGYAKKNPPFCSKCLNWNHTTDNCNSSEITFGGNVSISKDAYNWFWILDYPKYNDDITTVVEHLQTAYDNGTFTNKLTPKPENFRQFKWICCEALAKVVQEENYMSTSCLNEFQMRDVNIYGVPLFEHVSFLFAQIGHSESSDKLCNLQ